MPRLHSLVAQPDNFAGGHVDDADCVVMMIQRLNSPMMSKPREDLRPDDCGSTLSKFSMIWLDIIDVCGMVRGSRRVQVPSNMMVAKKCNCHCCDPLCCDLSKP